MVINMDKRRGRPRSEDTKNAILTASYELLIKNGFKAITIESIAARAGVSKATIYKWWPNKAAVVIDGYFAATELMMDIPDTGSLKEDLFIQAKNLAGFITSSDGNVIVELIAEGQFDKNVAEENRKRYFSPRREMSKEILARGNRRGELSNEVNIEQLVDFIYAPLFYRLLITGDPIDDGYIENIISFVLKGSN